VKISFPPQQKPEIQHLEDISHKWNDIELGVTKSRCRRHAEWNHLAQDIDT
jgi:hypothetical protein